MKNSKTFFFLLLLIFFFSGFSSLIYQVAWQRLLTVHYGLGHISTGIIVSLYMLGLGIGALVGERLSNRKNLIVVYCIVELLIGGFGALSPHILNFLGDATAGVNYVYTALFIFMFLCIPTFCMGATLPLLSRIYHSSSSSFLSRISLLYFINTLGAALGAVVSSFFLISLFGLKSSVDLAALINILLALAIAFLSKNTIWNQVQFNAENSPCEDLNINSERFISFAPFIVLITGFIAIGYEIIWFRLTGILLKDSPYAFSSILFIYLLSIAAGSYWMSFKKGNFGVNEKIKMFSSFQLYIALYSLIVVTGFYFLLKHDLLLQKFVNFSFSHNLHPDFQMNLIGMNWFLLFDILIWPSLFIFVPAFFMGAGFPLMVDIQYYRSRDAAGSVSQTYFFNVLGNVLGGLLMSFIILPFTGTERSLLLLAALGASFYFYTAPSGLRKPRRSLTLAATLLSCFMFFPSAGKLYEIMHSKFNRNSKLIVTEGIEGVICTEQSQDTLRTFINGSQHGGRPGYSFQFQVFKSLSCTKRPEKVLVIGFGTGTNVEGYLKSDRVKEVTLVEINSTLIKNLQTIPVTHEILSDPKLTLHVEDGRRFLLTTEMEFDIISMDPLRTTTAYSNNIYSVEFFELIKKKLRKDGLLVLWSDNLPVIAKTVYQVFPKVNLYDGVILASNRDLREDTMYFGSLREDLNSAGRAVIDHYNRKFLGNEEYITLNYNKSPFNTDWLPISEYYLWRKKK